MSIHTSLNTSRAGLALALQHHGAALLGWISAWSLPMVLAFAISILAGCGGGGGGATTTTITGTAAVGAAIAQGKVDIKCQNATATATTQADGSYSTQTTGTLPCVLRVTSADGQTVLHGVANGAGSEVVGNITPLTDLVLANATGQLPSVYFDEATSTTLKTLSTATLEAAKTQVSTGLAALVDISGVDPLAGKFTVGDATDQKLDQLASELNKRSATLTTLRQAFVTTLPTGKTHGAYVAALLNPSRVASDINVDNTLSGAFAEGVSADPATGDLYIGTYGAADTPVASLVLKASASQTSFVDWLPVSALGGPTQAFVTGTRIQNGTLYACINRAFASARVWAIKLADKTVVGKFSLPSTEIFCNDLAFDVSGNLFATTNSFGLSSTESVYKLPAATVQTGGTVASTAWGQWSTGGGHVNGLVFDSKNNKLLWRQDNLVVSSPTSASTASPTLEVTLPVDRFPDGMQLTSAGNLLIVTGNGAEVVSLAPATKGTLTAVVGGTACKTTIAIVGDDAFCAATKVQPKVLRLAGAGKL